MITPTDDSYTHQRVAPHSVPEYEDPRWAERCYHLLFCDEELMLCAGRQLYPYGGRRAAFVAVAGQNEQINVRFGAPFSLGDDPNEPGVGPLVLEPRRPLHEWSLRLDDPEIPVGLDLEFEARLPPFESRRNRIEQHGEVVTDYMNFFQSGLYRGTVSVGGTERRVDERLGFRDRGWGLRKHEGSPGRGLVVFCACELDDAAIYVLLYETASGRRVFTDGARLSGEERLSVVGCGHELKFADGLLERGRLDLELEDGASGQLEFDVRNRLFLSGVGYSKEPVRPGMERWDTSDADIRRRVSGQNDNGCTFRMGRATGHGFIETGLGIHARYRPEANGR